MNSTPPATASRFSQLLHRSTSFGSDRGSISAEAENTTPTAIDFRLAAGSTRQRVELPVGSFSSSSNIPTRSYFQRPFHSTAGFADVHPTSSLGVREETAELASRALADDLQGSSPPLFQHSRADPHLVLNADPQASSSRDVLRQQISTGVNLPAPIPELSEFSEQLSPPASTSGPKSRSSILTQMIRSSPPKEDEQAVDDVSSDDDDESSFGAVTVQPAILSRPHEQTSLLPQRITGDLQSYGSRAPVEDVEGQSRRFNRQLTGVKSKVIDFRRSSRRAFRTIFPLQAWTREEVWTHLVVQPAHCLPAVLLGLLLNILDALSYGMILFPLGQPIFADLGPDGISMFYVSCIASQLVYSLGGSIFRGGVGSEMIEVVPFFHKMAFTIMAQVGDDPRAVLATTVLSYSLSSVLTGVVFFLLGKCQLGLLIGFFPRHILIGCIGGVGYFLVATGLEVSARLDGNLEYNWDTLERLIRADTVFLWMIPLFLAVSLFIIKRWVKHSLTDAIWLVLIILIFYTVVAAVPDLSVADLRGKGWVFEAPAAGVPWYHFYSLYDFRIVDWAALVQTIPAMFALTFFGVLHVPINVPALGVSTGEDSVDVDRELKAHGYSNALSGLLGSIQNYLVYTNTVLFMRSGGDSRLAGVLLAVATFGILIAGPAIIGYIPVMVVGTLIFFLGLDLMREALVDTIGRVHKLEYVTILIIVVTMGAYDFVVGILAGIVLACVSFVLQTSQISAIRGTLPGGVASSMVRRHPIQHRFLQEVGRQTYVMKLAGYLFFGTIVGVENSIRAVLKDDAFNSRPLQFLVFDLSKVDGVDFSAAEAFTRINRILNARDVQMILCGFNVTSDVGHSLQNVGLLHPEDGVEFFDVLNSALEHCENELLKAFYQQRTALNDKSAPTPSKTLDVPSANVTPPNFPTELAFSSPRRGQLHTAMATTMREQEQILPPRAWQRQAQPLQLILQTFANFSDNRTVTFWEAAVPYFSRRVFTKGHILYHAGDRPDGFYLLETGILRAMYKAPPHGAYTEVIAAGATCGELPFFGDTRRTAMVLAERDVVAWVLEPAAWARCQAESPHLAAEMLKIGLRLTSERMQALTRYMLLAGA